MFINYLPSTITSQTLIFVDDTKCLQQITSTSDIQQLQNDHDLFNWCIYPLMSLSEFPLLQVQSTLLMATQYPNHLAARTWASSLLMLSWREHYKMIIFKAYKSLCVQRRVFKDSQTRKCLYISFVRRICYYNCGDHTC